MLLANEQTDHNSPNFNEADNLSAVDVGHLCSDTRPFFVQKPNFSGDYPEAAIREGADELTLRAEEVKTLKACIDIDHIEEKQMGTGGGRSGLARLLPSNS